MGIRTWPWGLGIALTLPLAGRAQTAADLTNLREDINGLTQRVSELTLRVEQLENAAAMSRASKPGGEVVTSAQLQSAVADLTAQMERLRAMVPVAAAAPPAAEPAAGQRVGDNALRHFSDDFPKQGIAYAVQKGDTLALIAKKTGAKFQDIVNANQLADPSKIRIGQKLFIPGGK